MFKPDRYYSMYNNDESSKGAGSIEDMTHERADLFLWS